MAEEYDRLLVSLKRPELRSIAVWKIEGYTTEEIAARMGCVGGTIKHKLQLIRKTWERNATS